MHRIYLTNKKEFVDNIHNSLQNIKLIKEKYHYYFSWIHRYIPTTPLIFVKKYHDVESELKNTPLISDIRNIVTEYINDIININYHLAIEYVITSARFQFKIFFESKDADISRFMYEIEYTNNDTMTHVQYITKKNNLFCSSQQDCSNIICECNTYRDSEEYSDYPIHHMFEYCNLLPIFNYILTHYYHKPNNPKWCSEFKIICTTQNKYIIDYCSDTDTEDGYDAKQYINIRNLKKTKNTIVISNIISNIMNKTFEQYRNTEYIMKIFSTTFN